MALYFLDSLAIVKRYFQEQRHNGIETVVLLDLCCAILENQSVKNPKAGW
jgi:hypothetical protein